MNFRLYAYMFRLYSHKHCEIAKLFLAQQHLKKKDCLVLSQFDRGVLPYKSDGAARRENSRTPLKGVRVLFYGRVNSTTTNYVTGTAKFSKITFEHSLLKDFLKVLP